MSASDVHAAGRYIERVALPPPTNWLDSPVSLPGFVNAAMTTIFQDGDATEAIQDVLDSQLFAWLAATAKYGVYKDSAAWWGFYREILERVGWTVQAYSFSAYTPTQRRFTISDWVADVLDRVDPEDAAPVARALAQLQNLAGSIPTATFDAYSHDRRNGALQVLVGRVIGQDPQVRALACTFTTADDMPIELLPYQFSADASTCANAFVTTTLNEQVYGPLRTTIKERLACNPTRYTQPFTVS